MGKGDGSRRVLRKVKQVKKGPSSHAQTEMHTAREGEEELQSEERAQNYNAGITEPWWGRVPYLDS